MGLVDKFVKNRMQAMVQKTIKQKRLKFVDGHQVVYTDRENITRQLTFEQFAVLMVDKVIDNNPKAREGIGNTAQIIKGVLGEEYKRRAKKV